MDVGQYLFFNLLEGLLWCAIGAAFLLHAAAGKFRNRLALLVALAFFVFGLTDFIERETLAWWRPLWLLALKGACVLTFLLCYLQYRKNRRSGK